jgi:hypothetical protein
MILRFQYYTLYYNYYTLYIFTLVNMSTNFGGRSEIFIGYHLRLKRKSLHSPYHTDHSQPL